MPWTMKNPPSPAKNWTEGEKRKCVDAANAVLADGGTDEDAIYACISAAGKTAKTIAKADSFDKDLYAEERADSLKLTEDATAATEGAQFTRGVNRVEAISDEAWEAAEAAGDD